MTGPHAPWSEARAREIIESLAGVEGALLPALHALQAEFGWVSDEAVALAAEVLNLSRAEVHGAVTFYHDFHRAPPPRHVLKLCRAEACQARGGRAAVARAVGAGARLGRGEDGRRLGAGAGLLPRPVRQRTGCDAGR